MKRNTLILAMLMSGCLISNVMAEEIKLKPLDYSHPAVKLVIARQKALANGGYEFLWSTMSKKTQEFLGPGDFINFHLSLEGKNRDALISKAGLSGIRVISDNRVWIEAGASDLTLFKGFYFVKEDGLWKYTPIGEYVKAAESDLNSLTNAINNYYKKNKKLPRSLADLSVDIPVDLFSDNNAPYQYKVISNVSYVLYSLGPDSDDDNGLVEYIRKEHPISDGDIIKKVVVQ